MSGTQHIRSRPGISLTFTVVSRQVRRNLVQKVAFQGFVEHLVMSSIERTCSATTCDWSVIHVCDCHYSSLYFTIL